MVLACIRQLLPAQIFFLCASVRRIYVAVNSLNNAQGGPWKHTLFTPIFLPSKHRSTLHVAMTMYHADSYEPPFEDATGFMRYTNNNLPELNHFVTMSNDNASLAKSLAVKKFEQLKHSAVKEAKAAISLREGLLLDPATDSMGIPEQDDLYGRLERSAEKVRT